VPGLSAAGLSRPSRGELDLHLEVGETRPARALERALRDAIVAGRVPAGGRLPATRGLAADLGIARATVSEVYAQLAAEGWLQSRVGAGTWVAQTAALPAQAVPEPAARPSAAPRPYWGGIPDVSLFPRGEWAAAARRAMDVATAAELGYQDRRGSHRLRQELSGYLRRTRGAEATAERTVIGQGFGGLLALACRSMAAAGARRLAVEAYGHPRHRDIAAAAGLDVVPLPVDGEGADVARLGPEVDGVLLTTAHQFPTGVPLSPARRRAVIAWAREAGALVIEDDYDGEFRYERRAVGALQGMAPDQVLYIGTASKALVPAVGLAWAVVPEARMAGLLAQRAVLSEPRDALNQLTLAEFIAAHSFDRHVRRMRAEYRRRREHLAARLAERVPAARLAGVPAGIQALVSLPPGSDPDLVVAAGLRRGLAFDALHEYAADPGAWHPPAVVLGFGASPATRALADIDLAVAAIEDGIADRILQSPCVEGER
jgi:GntR family transcriptional regulator / MocR family aminotransferase